MRIYYDKSNYIEVNPNLASELVASGHFIYKHGRYRVNIKHKDTKYLFHPKIHPIKQKIYFDVISNNNFICADCGKKHSFQVRPVQEKGTINFKKSVNVCDDCRIKFLEKKDLLSLQFKERIDWDAEKKKTLKEMKTKEIIDRNRFFKLSMEIVKAEKIASTKLPSIIENKSVDEIILDEYRQIIEKHLSNNIDLDAFENRKIVRDYLMAESGGVCMVCGSKHTFLTIDHVIAKDLGGKDSISNFIGMCKKCNLIKKNKSIIEFLASVEMGRIPLRVLKEAHKQQAEMKAYLKELYKERDLLVQEGYVEKNS